MMIFPGVFVYFAVQFWPAQDKLHVDWYQFSVHNNQLPWHWIRMYMCYHNHHVLLVAYIMAVHWLTHWGRVAHMCTSIIVSLVQIMACRIFGAKPLSESMLEYCQLDTSEQILTFPFKKMHLCLRMAAIYSRPQWVKLTSQWLYQPFLYK